MTKGSVSLILEDGDFNMDALIEKLYKHIDFVKEKLLERMRTFDLNDLHPGGQIKIYNLDTKETVSENAQEVYSLCKDTLARLEYAKKFILMDENAAKEEGLIFNNLSILSPILTEGGFTKEENYDIILFFLEKSFSIQMKYESSYHVVDAEQVLAYPFQSMSKEEIKDLFRKSEIYRILEKRPKNEKEERLMNEFFDHVDEFIITPLEFEYQKQLIEKLSKKNGVDTQEELDQIRFYLSKLGLPEECSQILMEVATKKFYRRQNKANEIQANVPLKHYVYKGKDTKVYLNDEQYKALKKKLKAVYDPYDRQFKKALAYEELLETASIMIKLGYSKDEVYTLFRFGMHGVKKEASILTFVEDYEKYLYYLEQDEVKNALEYLKEMMISTDDDYAFWKSAFIEEVEKLEMQIPLKYDYEYQLAKKM